MLSHTAGVPEPPRQGRTFSSTKCLRAQDAGWKKPCAYPLRRYGGGCRAFGVQCANQVFLFSNLRLKHMGVLFL